MNGDDPELAMLYYLFVRHDVTPGRFYRMSAGERVLLDAFCQAEIDQSKR